MIIPTIFPQSSHLYSRFVLSEYHSLSYLSQWHWYRKP